MEIRRFLMEDLDAWRSSPRRKPLVLKGIRQCGKTHLLKEFGRTRYKDVAYFKFERNKPLRQVFERDLDIDRILKELSAVHGCRITTDTLIVFDEIQFCAAALTSLKYFQEDRPEYHVACAGSLLGLRLPDDREDGDSELSYPAGKVDHLIMRPLCFGEFLLATRGESAYSAISDLGPDDPIPESMMPMLSDALDEYMCVGGMPEAVSVWLDTGDMEAVEKAHNDILISYDSDFLKHAPPELSARISAVWESVPDQLAKENKRFYLDQAVKGSRSKDMDEAIQWLIDGGLIHRVRMVERPSVPATRERVIGLFKLYCCDVGLMRTMLGVDSRDIFQKTPASDQFRGAQAENIVLGEMVYSAGIRAGRQVKWTYWNNDRGNAELDFIVSFGGRSVPVEVKAGTDVAGLRGMNAYVSENDPDVAVVVSRQNMRRKDTEFLFMPAYLAWRFMDIVRRITGRSGLAPIPLPPSGAPSGPCMPGRHRAVEGVHPVRVVRLGVAADDERATGS